MPKVARSAKNRPRGVRWTPEEWRQIQQAAAKLAEQLGMRATAADVIRRGTQREVRDLLGAA